MREPLGLTGREPRLTWCLPGDVDPGCRVMAFVADTREDLTAGRYLWKSASQPATEVAVVYRGPPLGDGQRLWWRVEARSPTGVWRSPESWFEAGISDERWRAAWVGLPRSHEQHDDHAPCPHLRGRVDVVGKIARARLHVTSAGVHVLFINGQRVGDRHFRPGWTDYGKTLYADTHDVTDLLSEGENWIGALLGDGWYAGAIGFDNRREVYGSSLCIRAQLEVRFLDGRRETYCSGSDWQGRFGAILASDRHAGEVYDARRQLIDWCVPGGADEQDPSWRAVTGFAGLRTSLTGACYPPVRITKEHKPQTVSRNARGDLILDFGRNLAGWIRLHLRGYAGQIVRVEYGELLLPDGGLYRENLNGARSIDTLILREGSLLWEPTFTYHGFRYASLTGLASDLDLVCAVACEVGSDVDESGEFDCASKGVSALVDAMRQTLRSNLFEVLTDCPQRDERLGWLGDSHGAMYSACCLFDLQSFLSKWVQDMRDAQQPDGTFPPFAPNYVQLPEGFRRGWPDLGGAVPGWSDGAVLIPWIAYQHYGDLDALRAHFPAMERWAVRTQQLAEGSIWRAPAHKILFRDFLELGEHTAPDLVCTAFMIRTLDVTAAAARELGEVATADRFGHAANRAREAFCDRFLEPGGLLCSDSQGAYTFALAFNLVPDSRRFSLFTRLVERIAEVGHLSTGALSTRYVLPLLSAFSRHDLAWDLMLKEDFPSYLWWIRHGLSTLPEHWDGIDATGRILDTPGNSFNHFTFGSYVEWLFGYAAGVQPGAPGWRHIRFEPRPDARVGHLAVTMNTVAGRVCCRWTVRGQATTVEVEVPAMATATLDTGNAIVRLSPGAHRIELRTEALARRASTILPC